MNKPLVSIGIPVYNDEAWVRNTLQHVINQDYKNLEIIVVDDFSRDKTREICKSFQTTDHRIIFHENPFNIGAIENHKLVFNLSHGEYFIWCNGHDYFDPSYISKCAASLERDNNLQLCCGKTDIISMDGVTCKTLFQSLDTRGMSVVDRFQAVYWASIKNACIFYGVFRSECIKNTNPFRKTLGGDLIFLSEVALKGHILQRDDITYYRQRVRPELTGEQAKQHWIELIVQPEGHCLEALTPWLNMAYEYLNMIVNLRRPATEQEVLLATAIDLLKQNFGGLIQSEIEKLISVNIEEISGHFNRNIYLTEIVPYFNKAKFFYQNIEKLNNLLYKCIGMTGQTDELLSVPSRPLQFDDINKLPSIKLYAGDIPDMKEYAGWIGLSLTRNDSQHIHHDITQPFPLPDNSVEAFQAEDVLEHIPYDRLALIINEIFRVLKPGGLFRLSVPDYGCDILRERSVRDEFGNIIFDPAGGGTPENPGHVWFPRIDNVKVFLEQSPFARCGVIKYLHYYNMDGSFVTSMIDYTKGHVQRTPDFDVRVQSPYRPMSLVVDLVKKSNAEKDCRTSQPRSSTVSVPAWTDFPRLSFIIIVLNGMPFLEFALKAIYEIAQEIIIVEGAVEKCMFAANPDGSSKDGTVEYIRCFPDPEHKLRLIQGRWAEKCEMQNEALKYITGDYVWLVDSDEVYKQEDLKRVRELLKQDPSITQVNFIPDNFWKGFDYIFVSPRFFEDSAHYRRVFKFVRGAVFTSHRPPTMAYPGSSITTEQMHLLSGSETRKMGIYPYHYSYVLDEQVVQKVELYNRYGWGKMWGIDLSDWYRNGFLAWTPDNRAVKEKQYPVWTGDRNSYTVKFEGTHPEVIAAYIAEYKVRNIKKGLKIAGDVTQKMDLTSVDDESEFARSIGRLFEQIRPQNIIETGTYLGEGTTKVIATALRNLSLSNAVFNSIECNPQNHACARENLRNNNLLPFVTLLNGLSLPRKLLPTLAEIENNYVCNIEFDDIFVDHKEQDRALLYYRETDFHDMPEDLLGECLRQCNFRPDFVLLDSGGHIGNIEFNYLIGKLKDQCYIALDDINHVKHHKSLLQMRADRRFNIIVESKEKFGFCIAKFMPHWKLLSENIKNVIWLRTDSIGDNILAASMLPYIRDRYKDALITVVCQGHISELYEACPHVDKIIPFDRNKALSDEDYRNSIIEEMRATKADLMLNSVYSREQLTDVFALMSGAKELVALVGDLSNISPEMRRQNNALYTVLLASDSEIKTELERSRNFLDSIGIEVPKLEPMMWITPEDEKFAESFFKDNGLDVTKTIALFAGAQYGVRTYDQYGQALRSISIEHAFTILALGSPVDFEVNQKCLDATGARTFNLSGKTTLRQTAALIKRCRLAVGAETGIAHMACAMGTPNVILLGGGHFGRFMPYSALTTVVCLPLDCYFCNWRCAFKQPHCVKDVESNVIAEAIRRTIDLKSSKPRVFVQGTSLWMSDLQKPLWRWFDEYIDIDVVEIIPVGTVPLLQRVANELYNKCRVRVTSGDIAGAVSDLEKLLEAAPGYALAHNDLGVLYFRLGDKEKALQHYEVAVKSQPDNAVFAKNLADLYFVEMGRIEDAIRIYHKVLAAHPEDIDSLLAIGNICINVEKFEDARVFFNRVIKIDPKNENANRGLDTLQKLEEQAQILSSETDIKAPIAPKISVVTPSYNQAQFIEQTIKSVLEQNYPNFEHIIIDGGSTDGTLEILKRYPYLKWISEEDKGQSDALNKGFKKATGDIIAWINSDDWYEPNAFPVIAKWFIENPEKNILMGDCNLIDENGRIFDKVINKERGFNELKQHWVPRSIPTQPAILFRKKLLDEFGCLDETLQYAMDYDLWMRFAQKYLFYHLDVTIANYRFHASAKGGDQDWSKFVPECTRVYQRYVSKMNSIPIVSVIIPCFNYGRYLQDAVESVINQTFQDFEIIIVNDGSTDNTVAVAENLISTYKSHRITLISIDNSGQPATPRNIGIAASIGKYILPLDADDKIAPRMLEKCAALLDQHIDISIAYTHRQDFGVSDVMVPALEYDFQKLKYTNLISYCALFRRKLWEDVGGYRTNNRLEDWDFWVAAGAIGHYGRLIPEPLFLYRRNTTGRYQNALENQHQEYARIVLNNSSAYSAEEISVAKEILGEAPRIESKPKVSVVIPTYNRPRMLREAVTSVLGQTFQDFEIVVVNDAGQDVSEIITSFHDSRIKYFQHPQNKGLSASRNTGIRNASGQYIALLDDDDIFYDHHLDTVFSNIGGWQVAYTDSMVATYELMEDEYVLIKKHLSFSMDFDRNKLLIGNIAPVNCFVFSRDLAVSVGLFDETLSVLEDWDFWVRFSELTSFKHIRRVTVQVSWRDDGSTMTSTGHRSFRAARDSLYRRNKSEIDKIPNADEILAGFNAIWSGALDIGEGQQIFLKEKVKGLTSIVVLAFNQIKYTRECVDNICKYTPEQYELIFVDNGSTDGTVEWLKGLAAETQNIKLVENRNNLGVAKCFNRGIIASSGENILLLNSDVVVTDGWLSGMLECLASFPDIGTVGPIMSNITGPQHDEFAVYSTMEEMHQYAALFRSRNRHRRIPLRKIDGSCMMIRRDLVEKIGFFYEKLDIGDFEEDYCLMALIEGYRNVVAGDVFVHRYFDRSLAIDKPDRGPAMSGSRQTFDAKWSALLKWSGIDRGNQIGKQLLISIAMENADELNQKGETDKAVERLVEGIKYVPESPEIYLAMSGILLEAKRYQDALDVLNSMPGEAKEDIKTLILTGYCKEGLELYAEAEEYAEKVLAKDNANASALNLKGMLMYKQGDRKSSEDFFKKAAEKDPGYGEPYTNLGVLKWSDGDKEAGLALFEKGFILSPVMMDSATMYHTAIIEMGEFEREEKIFREAKALHPINQRIVFLLIDLLLKQGKDKLAMQEIEKAIITFGIDDGLLSAALEVRGKVGAKEIDRAGGKGMLSLCMIVKNEEQYIAKCLMSVKPVADEMIVVDTGSTDRTKDIAKAFGAKVFDFQWTDDFSEARNYSLSKASGDRILILDADEVISELDHEKINALKADNKELNTAYVLDKRNYVDFFGLHGWTKNDNRYAEQAGIGWIRSRTIQIFPRHKDVRFVNPAHEFVEPSINELKIKDLDVPIHHYGHLNKERKKEKGRFYAELGKKKIGTSDNNNPKALWELGIQYLVNGNHSEALEMFLELSRLDDSLLQDGPEVAKVYMQAGICYMCLHNYSEALVFLEKAIATGTDLKEAHLNYATALIMLGRASEAVVPIETFCAKDKDYPHGKYLLAIAKFCTGKKEEGLSAISSIKGGDKTFNDFVTFFIKELAHMGRGDYITVILHSLNEILEITPELKDIFEKHTIEENIEKAKEKFEILDKSSSEAVKNEAGVQSSGPSSGDIITKDKGKDMTSIIILTFNQLKYTQECIESIQKHTSELHEIIFVDNGSTDGTVKWLKKLVREHSRYKLIENKTNLGFAKGCNQGIEASEGESILLLNNDVVVTEDWLSGMFECLESGPDIGIVGPMTNNISGTQKDVNATYRTIKDMHLYAKAFREKNLHRRIPLRRIVGFCMLFRRELVNKIGLLDESFGSGNFEDDDYCLRASLEGYRNMIAGDVFIHHYGSRSFIGNRIDYGSAMTGNRKIFNEKWSGINPGSVLGKRVLISSAIENAEELSQKGEIDKSVEILIEGIKQMPDSKEIYLALSGILIDVKRFQDALDALNSMPEEAKDDIKTILLTGYCKEGLELYAEAEGYAERVFAKDNSNAFALNLKGMLAYKNGDRKMTEDYFNKAIEADPGYGEPYTNLGVLKWSDGDKEAGLALLEKGFILLPKVMDSATLYHTAVIEMKELERAEKIFRDARALHPQNQRIAFLLIDILLQQGKEAAAMQAIEEAMATFTVDDGLLSAALAVREKVGPKEIIKGTKKKGTLSLCMIVKNEEKHIAKCLISARPIVDEMIVVDTGSIDRTKNIAKALGAKVYDFVWTEDFAEARNFSLSKASGQWILVLDGDEVISPLDYSSLSGLVNKSPAKAGAYTIVTRNYTNDISTQGWIPNEGRYSNEESGTGWFPSTKVRFFLNDKRIHFENPVHEFVDGTVVKAGLIIKHCDVPVHHYGRMDMEKTAVKGEAYYQLGKKKLEEKVNDPKALFELAVQAGELKKYAEALEIWKRLIKLTPNDPLALFNMGYALLQLDKFDEALEISKRAHELDPKSKEFAINYALCEFYVGEIEKTISTIEEVLQRINSYPPAMGLLAAAYSVSGRKEEGLNLIEKLGKKQFGCADFLYDMAKGLFNAKRVKQAMLLIEIAIKSRNITENTKALAEDCFKALKENEQKRTEPAKTDS